MASPNLSGTMNGKNSFLVQSRVNGSETLQALLHKKRLSLFHIRCNILQRAWSWNRNCSISRNGKGHQQKCSMGSGPTSLWDPWLMAIETSSWATAIASKASSDLKFVLAFCNVYLQLGGDSLERDSAILLPSKHRQNPQQPLILTVNLEIKPHYIFFERMQICAHNSISSYQLSLSLISSSRS